MKESFTEIKYKYEEGVYDKKYLIYLVQQKVITEEDFREITRNYYLKDAAEV